MKSLIRTGSVVWASSVKRAPYTDRVPFPLDTTEVTDFLNKYSSADHCICWNIYRFSCCAINLTSAFQTQSSRQPGNSTPRTMNSLSAIAGHEGDEEDWEREMRGLQNEEEVC